MTAERRELEHIARRRDPFHPDLIVLGFDGSKGRTRGVADACALAGIRIEDRRLHTVALWEQGRDEPEWEAPRDEIDARVEALMLTGLVVGMRADPAGGWADTIALWENRYRPLLWARFPISMGSYTPQSFDALYDAIDADRVNVDHDDVQLRQHLLNARNRGATVGKEHTGPNAPRIDLAAASAYASRALTDALAARPSKRPYSGRAMFL